MRKRTKWLVAATALIAASAQAADRGEFWISPHLGLSEAKVDGRHREFGQTQKYEGWTTGISAGYRAPFGLVIELGTSATGELFFGWATGGEIRENYAAVGYDLEFAKDWHFRPKIGLTDWELQAGELEDLVDDNGELTESRDGEALYLELGIARKVSDHIAVGFMLRAADVDFGSARSASINFNWTF
jgi:hypothetical protein